MGNDGLKPTILVVDDTVENIDILNGILRADYKIKVALDGEKALSIARAKDSPDLILLDIMMPGMDGYEVCKRLKQKPSTKSIPVIFVTTKGEVEDEARGFELGAVDYITKPVSPPIVHARVKTHLELSRSRQSVEQLLSKTLLGSIKLLTDILALINPQAFSQASRLKLYSRDIAANLNLDNIWQIEMAALLSQIGSLTIPPETLEKVYSKANLTIKEKEMTATHPQVGADLLTNIPRLETIACMIRQQNETVSNIHLKGEPREWDQKMLGGQILKIAIEFDVLTTSGQSPKDALVSLKSKGGIYHPLLLKAVTLNNLRDGMVLVDNITTKSGDTLFNKGTEVTINMIHLLERYGKFKKMVEPVRVRFNS